jgi:hypothetical protein
VASGFGFASLISFITKTQLDPAGRMVGWFFHAPDIVIDSGVEYGLAQVLGYQQMINTQTSPGFTVKPLTAIVKPAKHIIYL